MGASCWTTRVAWREDLATALTIVRARAYEAVSREDRERAAAAPVESILLALDLDLDDEDTVEAWSAWLADAPAETRYAAARGLNGTHCVLDIDHVVSTIPAKATPGFALGSMLVLSAPDPELGSLRWATREELVDRYETERPTEVDGDEWFDTLERGQAVAVTCWRDEQPHEIVICGVTGD
jgi:hypothetical protein